MPRLILHFSSTQVTRVVFVPDSADVIASELRLMSAAVDVVFTTGGVGPTLDDVTMAGVARAFNRALVRCGAVWGGGEIGCLVPAMCVTAWPLVGIVS